MLPIARQYASLDDVVLALLNSVNDQGRHPHDIAGICDYWPIHTVHSLDILATNGCGSTLNVVALGSAIIEGNCAETTLLEEA